MTLLHLVILILGHLHLIMSPMDHLHQNLHLTMMMDNQLHLPMVLLSLLTMMLLTQVMIPLIMKLMDHLHLAMDLLSLLTMMFLTQVSYDAPGLVYYWNSTLLFDIHFKNTSTLIFLAFKVSSESFFYENFKSVLTF